MLLHSLKLVIIIKANKRQYDLFTLLDKAYADVRNKRMSVYKAARIYGILESTLRDRTLGLQPVGKENLPDTGPGPLFSKTEEDELVNHITSGSRGAHPARAPLTATDL